MGDETNEILQRLTRVENSHTGYKDMTGQNIGVWNVVEFAGISKYKKALWKCICSNGHESVIIGTYLRSKQRKCSECIKDQGFKHGCARKGIRRTTEYMIWASMIGRCVNLKNKRYGDYGGRGINVCERWLNSFELFLEDMRERPTAKHTIDRINNDGNYEPGNCRWTTNVIQNRNKRLYKKNKSGMSGITWHKVRKKWQVGISVNGKTVYLGLFGELFDAMAVRKNAEIKYGYKENEVCYG